MMRILSAVSVALLCCLTGCWETLSWSPDGRYLVFVNPPGSEAWRWDSLTHQLLPLGGAPVQRAIYLDSSDRMLFLYALEDNDDKWRMVFRDTGAGIEHEVLAETMTYYFAVSPDGKHVYNIEDQNGSEVILKRSVADPGDVRELWRATVEIATPSMGTSSQGLLFAGARDNGSTLFRLRDNAAEPDVLFTEQDLEFIQPTWIDDDRVVFFRELSNSAAELDDWTELVLHRISTAQTTVLHGLVYPYAAPSLSPDRTRVIVTGVESHRVDEASRQLFGSIQVLSVALDGSGTIPLTQEVFGAGHAAYQPGANAIAYLSPPMGEAPGSTVRILNLDTREQRILWRDEDERAFASAEYLLYANRPMAAEAAYEDIVRIDPESPFLNLARYRLAEFAMNGHIVDLDRARALIDKLDDDWRDQALDMFWRPRIIVAHDLDAALVNDTAGVDNGDAKRARLDFEELRARWSHQRLYLRVVVGVPEGYNPPAFENVHLLFGADQQDGGPRQFAEGLNWDRAILRNVRIGYWRDNVSRPSYDVEVSNGDGVTLARLLSEGFDLSGDRPVNVYGVYELGKRQLAFDLSVSRRVLGMQGVSSAYLQVVATGESGVIDAFESRNIESRSDRVQGAATLIELD